ncbi:Hypothetical predicted protein [Pelobates cultripes]|uniref:Uncharacterized protein n=1 Tax=Pelobates cultripes TaxID=61616 RepID=A0AAD1W566_PELCU|nr:Hypothetical predicted protein [Pelobates cultripes]
MDGVLHTLAGAGHEVSDSNMPPSPLSGSSHATLVSICAELRSLAAWMVTKRDLQTLTSMLNNTIKAEMAMIRTEVNEQGTRIPVLEQTTQDLSTQVVASDQALARQGTMLLEMSRQMENLDNRGRRYNLRVRGLPEPNGPEDVERLLTSLFHFIVGEAAPAAYGFVRVHHALRPRSNNPTPRVIICC